MAIVLAFADVSVLEVGLATLTSVAQGVQPQEVIASFFEGVKVFSKGAVIISETMNKSFTVEPSG